MPPRSLADYLRAARQQRGYSLRQLRDISGIHNTTIQRIETGGISVPNPGILVALVDALDLDIITALKLCPAYRKLYERIAATQKGERR